jgi:hypothetical protein
MTQDEMGAALRAASARLRRTEPPERIEARLLDAFCAQTGAPRVPRPRAWWKPVLAWTAAAAAAVALALWLSPPRRSPAPDLLAHIAGNRLAPESQLPAGPDADNDVEAAGDEFTALPGADQAVPGAALNLVRVEMPRTAMAALGLPVGPGQTSDSVLADVVLDAGGIARAIRFVNP